VKKETKRRRPDLYTFSKTFCVKKPQPRGKSRADDQIFKRRSSLLRTALSCLPISGVERDKTHPGFLEAVSGANPFEFFVVAFPAKHSQKCNKETCGYRNHD
jgi:hypothetical protein